jgi:hypothetical protein
MSRARDLASLGDNAATLEKQGLTLINISTFSGAATHSFGSDASPIFTSTYANYKIILSNLNGANAVRAFSLRLRANTTDLSSGSYHYQQLTVAQTTVSAANAINQTSWPIGLASNGSGEISSIVIELQNPQAALSKTYLANNAYWQSGVGPSTRQNNGSVLNSNQYNGFTILSDGDISGTMAVYGYNK